MRGGCRLSKGQPFCPNIAFAIIANAIIMTVKKNNKARIDVRAFRESADGPGRD
jgi:hypothetical protein